MTDEYTSSTPPQVPELTGSGIERAGERLTKARPKGMRSITGLLLAGQVLEIITFRANPKFLLLWLISYVLLKAIIFVVLWFFWKGYNGARVALLLGAVSYLAGAFLLPREILLQQDFSITGMILAAFMIYWLNTAPVKKFFQTPGVAA